MESLYAVVSAINPQNFSKYQKLVALLTHPVSSMYWKGTDKTDRLVIFTERIATLEFLYEHLPRDLGVDKKAVTMFHGGMSDKEQQDIVEDFGREEAPVRLLLASDVASEGINLHHLCHRLIHFDIPWSLMVFQQRNGRIDRYGQEHAPLITYLSCESDNPKIKGDMRILELLIQKDEEAVKNIGDPSALMGVYDIDEEIEKTAAAVEMPQTPDEFESSALSAPSAGTREDGFNLLDFLQKGTTDAPVEDSTAAIRSMPTLFSNDFEYAAKAPWSG